MSHITEIITRLRRIAGNTSCVKTSFELTVIANELEHQKKESGENEK